MAGRELPRERQRRSWVEAGRSDFELARASTSAVRRQVTTPLLVAPFALSSGMAAQGAPTQLCLAARGALLAREDAAGEAGAQP